MSDVLLFVVWPYFAILLCVLGSIYRYYSDRFSYSSFSAQVLENRLLFWGNILWHYGVIVVLIPHFVGFVLPDLWAFLVADPVRLYVMEIVGYIAAVAAILGLSILILRRTTNDRVRAVTTVMDWGVVATLWVQLILGFWVALVYRWGSEWYVHTMSPWLWSLVTLNPRTEYIRGLPFVIQLHAIVGFLLFALFPFSRLVHIIALPITYLWRPYQVVVWNVRRFGALRAR
ncbi:MAG: respiratory nitrate reductase subunit gamma [Chloroflexota bacterium]